MKFYETHFCYVNLVIFLFAIKFLEDGYGFYSSQIWMWKLDHKEGWVPRNWCFWTVVLGKSLESPLDCKEINPRKSILNIHLKDWCWSWSSHTLATWCKDLIHQKRLWCRERLKAGGKGDNMTKDEMAGWHHLFNGHEFEKTVWDCGG